MNTAPELLALVDSLKKGVELLLKKVAEHEKEIWDLKVKCANLENAHLETVAAISITNPETYSIIKQCAETALKQLDEQGIASDDLYYLKVIAGVSEQKRPHLWIVPKKSEP